MQLKRRGHAKSMSPAVFKKYMPRLNETLRLNGPEGLKTRPHHNHCVNQQWMRVILSYGQGDRAATKSEVNAGAKRQQACSQTKPLGKRSEAQTTGSNSKSQDIVVLFRAPGAG